jgi:hypothetical protein
LTGITSCTVSLLLRGLQSLEAELVSTRQRQLQDPTRLHHFAMHAPPATTGAPRPQASSPPPPPPSSTSPLPPPRGATPSLPSVLPLSHSLSPPPSAGALSTSRPSSTIGSPVLVGRTTSTTSIDDSKTSSNDPILTVPIVATLATSAIELAEAPRSAAELGAAFGKPLPLQPPMDRDEGGPADRRAARDVIGSISWIADRSHQLELAETYFNGIADHDLLLCWMNYHLHQAEHRPAATTSTSANANASTRTGVPRAASSPTASTSLASVGGASSSLSGGSHPFHANLGRRVHNFTTHLADSECLLRLLSELSPQWGNLDALYHIDLDSRARAMLDVVRSSLPSIAELLEPASVVHSLQPDLVAIFMARLAIEHPSLPCDGPWFDINADDDAPTPRSRPALPAGQVPKYGPLNTLITEVETMAEELNRRARVAPDIPRAIRTAVHHVIAASVGVMDDAERRHQLWLRLRQRLKAFVVRTLTDRARGYPLRLPDYQLLRDQAAYTEFVTADGRPIAAMRDLSVALRSKDGTSLLTSSSPVPSHNSVTPSSMTSSPSPPPTAPSTEPAASPTPAATDNPQTDPNDPEAVLVAELLLIKQMVLQHYTRLRNIFRNYAQGDDRESSLSVSHADSMNIIEFWNFVRDTHLRSKYDTILHPSNAILISYSLLS